MEFNLATVVEAVEAAAPDRLAVAFRERELTYAQFGDRWRRLANALVGAGLGAHIDRSELAGHQSGQDHLAIYLHNGNEYLEAMVGAFAARVAPFNVNYRYVAEELRYLLADARAKAIVFHSSFAPVLDEVRRDLPELTTLWQVADSSGNDLLEGAQWYEDILSESNPTIIDELRSSWSPDDLYMLYTGGTTGMPKGVLWRQADIFCAALGGRQLANGEEWADLGAIVESAATGGAKLMPTPPFMHGAAHWMAFNAFTGGNSIVLPDVVDRFDPGDVMRVVTSYGVNILLIVGDAFGKPLVAELESGRWDTSSILAVVSGGAALSAGVKQRFLELMPAAMVLDGLGASETGQQGSQVATAGADPSTGDFTPGPGMAVLDETMTHELFAGHDGVGWLAQQGRVPLGYLGDADKTARTFPVINGVRHAVPGDRAQLNADGRLVLLGRDSATINTGGEKVFSEEVEAAFAGHVAVRDVVVTGRPSERWGNEVVAVIALADGHTPTDDELLTHAAEHIARYKLPKAIVRVPVVQRSPSGKADHRWAKGIAVGDG